MRLLIVVGLWLCFVGQALAATPVSINQLLEQDMALPHEVMPHGVPTFWDWGQQGFVSPPAPADYRAFTGWGQLYRCATAPHDPDDIIEIADVQTWQMDATGWTKTQYATQINGAAFPEDFSRNQIAPDVVSQGAGWIKVRLQDGYNFHFWPSQRAPFDPGTAQRVVVMARARLIGQGAAANCVGVSMGGDYWQSMSATYPNVTGAAVGRFKRVEGGWRLFTMNLNVRPPSSCAPFPFCFSASEMR